MEICRRYSIVLAMVIALFLSSCGVAGIEYSGGQMMLPAPAPGEIVALQPGTTIRGMYNVLQSAPGTQVMMKTFENGKQLFILSWPMREQGMAFIAVGEKSATKMQDVATAIGNGNLLELDTYKYFVTELEKNGWVRITPATLPVALRTAILSFAGGVSGALTNFFVVPIMPGMLTPPDLSEGING